MRKGLEQKVEATLASFDRAVKQSSTRQSDATGQQKHREKLDLDLAKLITGGAEAGPAGRPSCRPWDYAAFSARLGTFTPLNWFSKPAFASPPMCARYGWINTGRDTLSCECCGAKMHFRASARESANGTEDNGDTGGVGVADPPERGIAVAVVNPVSSSSFLPRLKSEHHDLCPWNGNACPQEFLQLPPMATEDLVTEFLGRLDSLVPVVVATALPEVSLPSSFEEVCPGGLSALAATARAIFARQVPHAPDSGNAAADVPVVAAREAAKGNSENKGSPTGGNKRQRDEGDVASTAGGVASEGGGDEHSGMSAFEDEVLGAAAALAVFGWRSAGPASSADPARSLVDGRSPSTSLIEENADGGSQSSPKVTNRLTCALCKRRVVTDNFLTLEAQEGPGKGASSSGAGGGDAGLSSPERRAGDGRSGKRRRLSGGGTPLKRMDLAMEHRSFCPWANVHPPVKGESDIGRVQLEAQGAVPGWRQVLEALLDWVDPAGKELELTAVASTPEEAEGLNDTDTGKAGEALQRVQEVLGVLMRY
ncbi:unnamed protein product [Scytosiphon promiscuus]